MRLDLSSLDLMVTGPSSPGVAASLRVRSEAGAPTTIPDFAMGFGMPVPAAVKAAFAAFGTIDDGGTWMHTDPARADQRWFVQWRDESALLFGETSAGGVDADGLRFKNARMRVFLRSGRADSGVLRFWLEGEAELTADVGPLKLNGVKGTFSLEIDATGLPDPQSIVQDPAHVLDGAFTGRLTLSLSAAHVNILSAVELRAATIGLTARVTSAAGARRLRLDDATLTLGGRFLFAQAEFAQARLSGRWNPTAAEIVLEGDGALTLPNSIARGLTGAGITASLRWRCTAASTRLDMRAASARLDPAFNVLGLSGVGVTISFAHESASNRWSFTTEGRVVESWARLAESAERLGLVRLGPGASFPDVEATMSITAQSLPAGAGPAALRFSLDLALVRNGSPYEGRLGALPIEVSAPRFSFAADIGPARFTAVTADGSGRLRTTGDLARVLPLEGLTLGARLVAVADGPLALQLLLTGMPPLRLPALRPGGGSIELFRLDSAELSIGAQLQFGGTVTVIPNLSPAQLVSRLGLPAEFNGFLQPIAGMLTGLAGRWDVSFDTASGGGRLDFAFSKPDAPELDVFEILKALFPPGARAGGAFPLGDDFTLLSVRPGSIRFTIAFGGTVGSLLEIDAGVQCTVLDEGFDAHAALRVRGSEVELELAAGVDDPISLRFPGIPAFGANTANMLLDQLKGLYAVPAGRINAIRGTIEDVLDVFRQPGMDTAAEFELRQLRFVIRPSDANAPLAVSGTIRPVRLPSLVDRVLPVTPSVTLGVTPRSIYFELRVEEDPAHPPKPLFSVPLGANSGVDLILHGFKVAYAWDSNSVDLALQADVNMRNTQLFNPAIGTGVLLPQATAAAPSIATSFALKTIATVPPIPVPEWNITFGNLASAANRGLELVVGIPNQRFVTLNLRKTAFSVTRTLFGPGADFDGGFLFGNMPANDHDLSQFHLRGFCRNGTVITYPMPLVPLFNPFGSLFPPPFPIPPHNMGDIFFDELALVMNIPGLLHASLSYEKPIPEISLFTIIEMIYLASTGFTAPIPPASSLRRVYSAALRGSLTLPLPPLLFGTGPGGATKLAEMVDLDVEFNAADLLAVVGQAIKLGGQLLDATAHGLDLLVNHPGLLLRLIPRENRSFRFDQSLGIANLKLWLRASVFLLAPDELKSELVLYHESRRSVGKGVGRVRMQATPPRPGRVIDVLAVGVLQRNVIARLVDDARNTFDSKGAGFQNLIARKRGELEGKVQALTREDVQAKLRPALRAAVRRALFDGRPSFWSTLMPMSAAKRRAELEKRGLGYAAALVEQAIADLSRAPATEAQVQDRLTKAIADAAPLTTPEPLDLGVDRKSLAAEIASKIVVDVPNARGGAARAATPARATRTKYFGTRFTRSEHDPVRRALDEIGVEAEQELAASPPKTKAQADALRAKIESKVRTALDERAVSMRAVDPGRLGPALAGGLRVEDALQGAFLDRRKTRDVTKSVTLLDLGRAQKLALKVGVAAGVGVPIGNRVRELKGHEIRPRPEGPHAARAFAVPVPNPNTGFRVVFRQGRFTLITFDSRGRELGATDLPAEIVGGRGPTPGAAAALTRGFEILPKVVERALRPNEIAQRDDDPQERSTSLYQQSIFAREEYVIRNQGGSRGKLTLADILRGTNGTYASVGGPVLVAGGRLDLFNDGSSRVDLGVVGLLAPPFGGGKSGIFLYGHSRVDIPLPFGYEVELEGDFHVVTGDMWPASLADGSIERDSVSFSGTAKLSRNGRTIFDCSASGYFKYPSADGSTNLRLKLAVTVGASWELEFLETSYMKAWFEVGGELTIAFTNGTLSIGFNAAARLSWQLATFGTKTIVESPAVTICGPNPLWLLPGQSDRICVTTPAVKIEVPDPTHTAWGNPVEIDARVTASLNNGGLRFRVRVENDARFNFEFDP